MFLPPWISKALSNNQGQPQVTQAQFANGGADWRVKLSLPDGYASSPIMAKLAAAGGFVFPYTPQITLGGTATYGMVSPVHSNYNFPAYEKSYADEIRISGDFYCEDSADAENWIASVHYLRSVTKMVSGESNAENAGAPPPIVMLNGYGDYVFKNVPVVVKKFDVDLPKDVDYISTQSSSASSLQYGPPKTAPATAVTWVPVKSTITVTLIPTYSREKVRQFNLTDFVNGEYVFSGKGYL